MAANGETNGPAVYRFSGTDPAKYKGWRKWARARLNRVTKQELATEAQASALVEVIELGSVAFQAIKEIEDDVIESVDGE